MFFWLKVGSRVFIIGNRDKALEHMREVES